MGAYRTATVCDAMRHEKHAFCDGRYTLKTTVFYNSTSYFSTHTERQIFGFRAEPTAFCVGSKPFSPRANFNDRGLHVLCPAQDRSEREMRPEMV